MQRPNKAFSHYEFEHNYQAELDRKYPSRLKVYNKGQISEDETNNTHYFYQHVGESLIKLKDYQFILKPGMFASVAGSYNLENHSGNSQGIVITRDNWLGYTLIGGPVEHKGRLKYIDGCTDSLLLSPPKLGDPCLNLLYFPPDIDQTMHDHPSDRIGIIMSGYGQCVAKNLNGEEETIDLIPGMIFCIHAHGLHKFKTPYGKDMRVLAYHPDSDFGPNDENHPMLNRTIVDGISAKDIESIRTK